MTPPKHLARLRIVFAAHIPARQVENMIPTLSSYGRFIEEIPRTFRLETQVEGKRKAVMSILKEWEQQGFVCWDEITGG